MVASIKYPGLKDYIIKGHMCCFVQSDCVRERARTDLCAGPCTGGDQRDYTGCDCVRMTRGVYPGYMKW